MPGVSSKAVMPPDNTAQVFEKGMKEKPAAQRIPSGRIATNKTAVAERGDKNAGKH